MMRLGIYVFECLGFAQAGVSAIERFDAWPSIFAPAWRVQIHFMPGR